MRSCANVGCLDFVAKWWAQWCLAIEDAEVPINNSQLKASSSKDQLRWKTQEFSPKVSEQQGAYSTKAFQQGGVYGTQKNVTDADAVQIPLDMPKSVDNLRSNTAGLPKDHMLQQIGLGDPSGQPNQASQGHQERIGQPNRASQGAQEHTELKNAGEREPCGNHQSSVGGWDLRPSVGGWLLPLHYPKATAKTDEANKEANEDVIQPRKSPSVQDLIGEWEAKGTQNAERSSSDKPLSRDNSLSLFRDVGDLVEEDDSQPQYIAQNTDVPIIVVTSEVNPFSKTSGLALVCQSYGMEFAKRGHRTMVVSPMYDNYPNCEFVGSTRIWLVGGESEVKFFHQSRDQGAGVSADFVFVDHPCYHKPGGLYNNGGVEYQDNLFRFALLSLAALEVPKIPIPWSKHSCRKEPQPYGDKVVFMANDWQAALLPVYLVHRYRPRGDYSDARCLYIVHNFGYQGIYSLNKIVRSRDGTLPEVVKNISIEDLGLEPQYVWRDLIYVYPPHERQYPGDDGHVLNLSKAALMTADRILTVSPGYASEMMTVEGGFRLQEVVKMREFWLTGILNGIDVARWNPMTDALLATNFGPTTDFLQGRAACKKQLQEHLNLKVDPNVALVSFIGRFVDQKGIDVIIQAIDWLMTDTGNGVTGHMQLILMGHGDPVYANAICAAEERYRGLFRGYVGFDAKVEHVMYGGSDLFLMPSRYEPCGLPQMYAMRYGCIPVVTLCGGLKDSVVTDPPEEATGFGILPLTVDKFKEVTYIALEMFHKDKKRFQAMQARGMRKDFSWCRALDQYEQHIDLSLKDKPYVQWTEHLADGPSRISGDNLSFSVLQSDSRYAGHLS